MSNITKEWFSHAFNKRRFPNNPKNLELQKGVDSARFVRCEKAMYRLPVYLPLRWDLPALAPLAPITTSTPNKLDFDVLIVGAISDSPKREVRFQSSDLEINPTYLGKSANVRLTLGEIAGTNKPNSGDAKVGINYFTSPFILYSGQQITLDMFKPEDTPNAEVANLVFVGYRVFSERASYGDYLVEETARIKQFIGTREVPRQQWLKQEIVFDANGFAKNFTTPDITEPLIVRGVRSTLSASLINEIKFRLGFSWVTAETPSWAIFCEPNANDNYLMFRDALYLPAKSEIEISLTNTITGSTTVDPNGSITWLCETV